MAQQNVPLLAFNRGLISPLAVARVDLDRTRLSAEVMTNWIPKTQGAMRIRPGTKYLGSSINDTGAAWIEFVAAVDNAALLELTDDKMRVWMDTGATVSLLSRPNVGAKTLSATDTGWTNASTGGTSTSGLVDLLPNMDTGSTNGVTITESSSFTGAGGWRIADKINTTWWRASGAVPEWVKFDFGSGNTKRVKKFTLRAGSQAWDLDNMANSWTLEGNHTDTGFSDTGNIEVSVSGESGWSQSEKRIYNDTGWTDTGANAWQYWRLNVSATNGDGETTIAEVELFEDSGAAQADFNAQGLVLNAKSIGALAKATKRVIVTDTGGHRDKEHSLNIHVTRGPVTFRCGSSEGDDDYVNETSLGTGYHNLAFTPANNYYITFQSDKDYDRIIGSIAIGDTGTVEITTPWDATDLDNIRYDQSADVVYVDAAGVKPHKIERRGTGRSWSVVEYNPDLGPFRGKTADAKFNVSKLSGNATLNSDIPFFKSSHVGSLFRMTNDGQSGVFLLGAKGARTDAIKVTGISDTGEATGPTVDNERRITFAMTGTYDGQITIERSFDDAEYGYHKVTANNFITSGAAEDTGTFTTVIDDDDDNITV
jgi:hypothetical protein